MENILLLVVVSVCCCVSSGTQVYYITPNRSNCSVENEILKPCYTLSQLILGDVMSSSKDYSIELVFLSGAHLNKQILRISNIDNVIIRPFTEKLEVLIECQPHDLTSSSFFFENVTNLSLNSLHLTSCSLQCHCHTKKENWTINITKCTIEKSMSKFAISIRRKLSSNSILNVALTDSTFSSNSRAVLEIQRTLMLRIEGQLQISNSLFQDNGKMKSSSTTLQAHSIAVTIKNSQFVNNTGLNVLNVFGSPLAMSNTVFQANSALRSCVLLQNSYLDIDFCQFVDNLVESAVKITFNLDGCDQNKSTVKDIFFHGNGKGLDKGGALYIKGTSTTLSIINCNFENNAAIHGGALYLENIKGKISNSTFTFNKAKQDGGAIYSHNSQVSLKDGINSSLNKAKGSGGFAYLSSSQFSIYDHTHVCHNKASNGGAVYATESSLHYSLNKVVFRNNSASKSGGVFYMIKSMIDINNDVGPLLFVHNSAVDKGGVIFVQDYDYNMWDQREVHDHPQCFLAFHNSHNISFRFVNNTASEGPVLYGGLLDRCKGQYSKRLSGIDHFKRMSEYDPTPLAITSEPVRVCLCTDDLQVNCSIREITHHGVMKGQTIHLLGAVVDQDSNPVQSFIRASYSELTTQLGRGESRRGTGNNCRHLSYHIYTTSASATLMLQPEGFWEYSKFSNLAISLIVKPCPTGFDNTDDRCERDKRLAKFHVTICNIDTYSIKIQRPIWIKYGQRFLEVHSSCPLDYCQATLKTISLEFPDEQCANHRSGVLCGTCQDNYSIALGGSKCLQCRTSNYTVIWLIPVFALAGIALVALLFVCNMTISHGTLNGLIFYANVVSITGLTSLQNCSIHPILSVFIAWINLDLGVETCFYSGMDTYQKTWLQFAFPLYIWLLVGAVILASQWSMTVVKLFGRSSIAVLATLFLLSYSKILKTIITALSITEVFRGSANNTSDPLVPYNVWAYDGNLEYLKGNHVALFSVAVILMVVLFLPYTLLLTFGQCLRSLPTRRRCILRCIRSTIFISIMDAYHAPYNKRHRYWTGLLLLTRCVLYLAFATSYTDNQLLSNMYITNLILVVILTMAMKVYKKFLRNLLEVCFLLNLTILSATLHYLEGNGNSDGSMCKCTSASILVSMFLFGSIVIYHAYLQLKKISCIASSQDRLFETWHRKCESLFRSAPVQQHPTSMTVQLREDLLESDQGDD